MFSFARSSAPKPKSESFSSKLYNQNTFYSSFIDDISSCEEEVYIESPFITKERVRSLIPVFTKLLRQGVKIRVTTRDPREHDLSMEVQAEEAIRAFEILGVEVLLCDGNIHRKLAILDRKITWEGSLNILSQTHSRELMRRIESSKIAQETLNFIDMERFF